MPQLTQGLIVAILIGLLLAVIVGYYLRQGQVSELTEALQQSQKRQDDLAQEHEQRLRDATLQLQKDYEGQLAETMERHQAQLEAQRSQLESEYRARQGFAGDVIPATVDGTAEQRIRKQYEARLKEAAAKIQQAYEQHLQERLVEGRSQVEQEYDQRLAEAIAHYQDEAQTRLAQQPNDINLGALIPEPTEATSLGAADPSQIEARLQAEYEQRLAEYQDDLAQRTAQLEQDYEARLQLAQANSAPGVPLTEPSTEELELNLRREIEERLRAEYEQKLAEKIEHYQNELTQRTQELEQSYEARLQLLQTTAAVDAPTPAVDGAEFDLDTAIAAANEAAMATSLEIDDVFAETSSPDALGNGVDLDETSLEFEGSLDFDDFSTEPTPDILNDASFSALIEGDAVSDQLDPNDALGLDPGFDTDELDLEALLNAPAPDAASEDLLEGLDDISDLS